MDGIINIYKEKGYTSHDVVAKLRGILKQKRIGHTGTLDPDAVGVLPVCIGKATSLCEFLTDKDKEYEAVIHLGIITDTLDMSGRVLERNDTNVTEEQFTECVNEFVGDIMQIPPMYSAIKINGKKLYDIARKGIEVEREPRPVHINNIDVISYDKVNMQARIRTTVSKGTYIRSLCDDIGKKLGCGACMGELIRTRSGIFELEDAVSLAQISDMKDNGQLSDMLIHIDDVFNMPCKKTLPEYDKRIRNGNDVSDDMLLDLYPDAGSYRFLITGKQDICIYQSDGSFTAVYRYNDELGIYRPLKMFL